MRRSTLAFLACLVLGSTTAGARLLDTYPVQGILEPSRPGAVDDSVRIAVGPARTSWEASLDVPASRPVFVAERALLLVRESFDASAGWMRGPGMTNLAKMGDDEARTDLVDVRVLVSEVTPGRQFALAPTPNSTLGSAAATHSMLGAHCEFAPNRLEIVGSPWTMRARCSFGAIASGTRDGLSIDNATIEVEARDPESGKAKTMRIETGAFTEPGPHPYVQGRSGHRYAVLTPLGATADLDIPGNGTFAVDAPKLTLSGPVSLPPGRGWIRWDDLRIQDPEVSVVMDATLIASPTAVGAMHVEGSAGAAPPMTAVPSGSEGRVIGGVFAIGLGAWILGRFAFGLLSRAMGAHAYDHARRRALRDLLSARPGLGMDELRAALGIPRTSLRYHLAYLMRSGLAHVRGRSHLTTYWPGPRPDAEVLAPLVEERIGHVERLRRDAPGLSQRELAQRLGVSQPTVSRLLRELRALQALQAAATGATDELSEVGRPAP